MKKFFRILTACLLALVMTVAVFGCKPKNPVEPEKPGVDEEFDPYNYEAKEYDTETRPFSMSISTPDGVFNPFFSTSAYDSTVLGMTQIGMLNSDKDGQVVCGDREPVVVKDWTSTYNESSDITTYKFIIKNGIKFSDGTDLTIKDVLFNLYVYLDPVYTGSATIYSTDIVGLRQYRYGEDLSDTGVAEREGEFNQQADRRVYDLKEYVKQFGQNDSGEDRPTTVYTEEQKAAFEADFAYVAKTFLEELNTDYNSVQSQVGDETYRKMGFTEAWQLFLYQDGGETDTIFQKNPDGTFVKNNEKNPIVDSEKIADWAETRELWIEENQSNYPNESGMNATEYAAYLSRCWVIDEVYSGYFPGSLTGTQYSRFVRVADYWMTAETVRTQFAAEAKSDYLEENSNVKKISGINTSKTSTDYHGNALDAEHDVLEIQINGIDPKAIWNFAFTVAPMNYYSSTNYKGHDYINGFNGTTEFGVKTGDINFMNDVVNAPEKIGLPKGAGTYMASNASGTPAKSSSEFFSNNMIYYERNPYFETLGCGVKDFGVRNAKIKYVRYKVVETDQIINALANGDIDYGDPSATQDNIAALDQSGVNHVEIKTSGYGYVGINPRFVPDITVRRAIMKAMDTTIITRNYYKGGLAELIYRPMSNTSWAYPKGCTIFKTDDSPVLHEKLDYSYDGTGEEITKMLRDAGYTPGGDGILTKGSDTLEYTFTIAGGSNDHPAYAMFLNAREILNRVGFNVKVVTSTTALSDLANGKLQVWAAAWSSTIDPDMYQIYHKDSKATSVRNWGYPQIAKDPTKYSKESEIIAKLSELIDAGRETDVQSEREEIYHDALDVVMELAVEMPTYQRRDMSAFNSSVLNVNTMTKEADRTSYNGLLAKLWVLNYN